MTTAKAVKDYIDTNKPSTFSLSCAYGYTQDMRRITFPAPVSSQRKDNDKGRCIKCVATYEDGSVLEYKYNANTETYKLLLKN